MKEENIINELLEQGYSKQEIDAILHTLTMQMIAEKKARQKKFPYIILQPFIKLYKKFTKLFS